MKRAEEAFDAASDRFGAAERALDEAREERAQARRDRYAARQEHQRAAAAADRLRQRVTELVGRLDRLSTCQAGASGPRGEHEVNDLFGGCRAGNSRLAAKPASGGSARGP